MKKEEEAALDFFRNGAAERVLERYEFSEQERKLIEDAIRSAKREFPRMKLVKEAEELLKKIAKSRQPKRTAKPIDMEKMDITFKHSASFTMEKAEEKARKKYMPWIMLVVFLSMLLFQYLYGYLKQKQLETHLYEGNNILQIDK